MDRGDRPFLHCGRRTWSHRDLDGFAGWWSRREPALAGRAMHDAVVIRAGVDPAHVMGVAALRRLRMAFAVLPERPEPPLLASVERLFPRHVDVSDSLVRLWREWDELEEREGRGGGDGGRGALDGQVDGRVGDGESANGEQPNGERPALWLFTSGSTGSPKCVPVSERQIRTAAEAFRPVFKPESGGAWLLALPLHHAGGLGVVMRSLQWHGAVWLAESRDASALAALLARESRIRTASLVATQLQRILLAGGDEAVGALRAVLLGGGPVPETLHARIRARSLPVWSGYGMSETFGAIAWADLRSVERPDQVGRPHPGCEMRVVDGEIQLRGQQVFEGYRDGAHYPNPFTTDGWFRTGDAGELDASGALRVLARRTDLILTGGENVRPAVVEEALEALDGVERAGVAGVPDPEWGQRVVALVQWRGEAAWGAQTERELMGAIKGRLAPHEVPKRIEAVEALPLSGLGKIRREALAQMARDVFGAEETGRERSGAGREAGEGVQEAGNPPKTRNQSG